MREPSLKENADGTNKCFLQNFFSTNFYFKNESTGSPLKNYMCNGSRSTFRGPTLMKIYITKQSAVSGKYQWDCWDKVCWIHACISNSASIRRGKKKSVLSLNEISKISPFTNPIFILIYCNNVSEIDGDSHFMYHVTISSATLYSRSNNDEAVTHHQNSFTSKETFFMISTF